MLIELRAALASFVKPLEIIDPREQLQYFSWYGYALFGVLYSMIVFFDEIPEKQRVIFSKQNKRSSTEVLFIHILFLASLFCAFLACARLIRYLPVWMTNEYDLGDGYISVADGLVFIGAAVAAACEKLLLETTEPGRNEE